MPGSSTVAIHADRDVYPSRAVARPIYQTAAFWSEDAGHPLAHASSVTLRDLDGVPLVHFAPDNGLSGWLDRSLTRAGVRPDPVMRTSVTSAAPQLAAAGLGVAVTPVSAVSAGLPGVVRSFSPRWIRPLVAVSPAALDPLAARFVASLRTRGVRVPRDVRAQLAGNGLPHPGE
jgi:DNA-binding transcriptional LysR family regulator